MTRHEVKLGKRDRQIIKAWHSGTLEAAGHYGDGEAIFIDEDILLRRLEKAEKSDSPAILTERNIEMILLWAEEAIARTAIGIDEFSLVKRLLETIGRNVEDYQHFSLRR